MLQNFDVFLTMWHILCPSKSTKNERPENIQMTKTEETMENKKNSQTAFLETDSENTSGNMTEKSTEIVPDCCAVPETTAAVVDNDPEPGRVSTGDVTVTRLFNVQGMTCQACVSRVEGALTNVPGVAEARVDLTRREAKVLYDDNQANLEDLQAAVEAVGYQLFDGPEGDSADKPGRIKGLFRKNAPYLIGVLAAAGVIGFYLGLQTLTSGWSSARMQFDAYRWWILALSAGLGIQATLFSLFRRRVGHTGKKEKCTMAASGSMSGTAMAACCAHYLVPILPLIGLPFLSSAAASLAQHQTYFFLAGVMSSLFGIGLMLWNMNKAGMIDLRIFLDRMTFRPKLVKP